MQIRLAVVAYDSEPCPTSGERARVPDTVETARQDTIWAVFADVSSGLWHQAVWGAWQGASWSPKGTISASRGVWNAPRVYLCRCRPMARTVASKAAYRGSSPCTGANDGCNHGVLPEWPIGAAWKADGRETGAKVRFLHAPPNTNFTGDARFRQNRRIHWVRVESASLSENNRQKPQSPTTATSLSPSRPEPVMGI